MKMTFKELELLDNLLYKFLCEFEDDLQYDDDAIAEGQKALEIALEYSEGGDEFVAIGALYDEFYTPKYPKWMSEELETLKNPWKACDTARLLLTHREIAFTLSEISRDFKI